jgi:hypothetical protein
LATEEKGGGGVSLFSEQAREWLSLNGPEAAQERAAAIETVVRESIQTDGHD